MKKPVTVEDIISFLKGEYYGKMGSAYRVRFRKDNQKSKWDWIEVTPQRRVSSEGFSWEDWQNLYVNPIINSIQPALDRKFGKGLRVSVTESGYVSIGGFDGKLNVIRPSDKKANLKNLMTRVADRHEKTARITEIEGKWKRVSPLIGTWFENLITKLGSLQDSMAYAEKIADKEFKRIETLVKRKFGKTDNWDDDEWEDPLVQAYYWIDDFWSQVSAGNRLNKFQRKIDEAKTELEQTIYDINGWGWHATRMASEKNSSTYVDFALKNFVDRLSKAFRPFKPSRADWTHIGSNEGWVFLMDRPAKPAKKIVDAFMKMIPRASGVKGWVQKSYRSDAYETSVLISRKADKYQQAMSVQLIIDNRVVEDPTGDNVGDPQYKVKRMKIYVWED